MIRKGFTLIELLVVVAVLALLASIVFSNLGGAREGARISNALSFQSQTHSLLGSDLVGWWNFNEGDARDISGYNNHGTIVGATHVDGVPGTGGSALIFNGSSHYIDTGYGQGIDPSINPHTFSIWARSNDIGKSAMFLAPTSLIGDTRAYFATYNTKWSMGIQNNGWGNGVIDVTNQWTHVTISMNGSTASMYINGEFSHSKSYSSYSFSTNFNIARGNGYHWNGVVDDVRFYSRALSASEVSTLYAQTKDRYLAENE